MMTFDKAMQKAAQIAMETREHDRTNMEEALVVLYHRWVEEKIVERNIEPGRGGRPIYTSGW